MYRISDERARAADDRDAEFADLIRRIGEAGTAIDSPNRSIADEAEDALRELRLLREVMEGASG